jgi:hypothetical protein
MHKKQRKHLLPPQSPKTLDPSNPKIIELKVTFFQKIQFSLGSQSTQGTKPLVLIPKNHGLELEGQLHPILELGL